MVSQPNSTFTSTLSHSMSVTQQSWISQWVDNTAIAQTVRAQSSRQKRPRIELDSIEAQPAHKKRAIHGKAKALVNTSGNIMSPNFEETVKKAQSQAQLGSPTRRQGTRRLQCSKDDPDKTTLTAATFDEETPKPRLRGYSKLALPHLPPPPGFAPRSIAKSLPSHDSGKSESSASSRSRSPVKTMADLCMAVRPTAYKTLDGNSSQEAGGVLSKYKRLRAISLGISVIPHSQRSLVETCLHPHDWPPTSAYEKRLSAVNGEREAYETQVGTQALHIYKTARQCQEEEVSEAEWNEQVHSPLLSLITDHPELRGKIGFKNITTARIVPESLAMIHGSGVKMQGKMVDYAIYLQPDAQMGKAINKILLTLGKEAQSVNQTMYPPIRQRPIAVSVETKVPFTGGATADVQLATWTGAGLTRIRQMLQANANDAETIPTIPALSAHGHDLHMQAFKEEKDGNIMYGNLRLGGSDTLLGVFQMVKGLEEISQWADIMFRPWYMKNVLKS